MILLKSSHFRRSTAAKPLTESVKTCSLSIYNIQKKSLPGDKLPLLFLCAWKVNETVHFRIDMTGMHYYLVGFALAAEFPLGNAHQLTRYYMYVLWVKCTQMRSYVSADVSFRLVSCFKKRSMVSHKLRLLVFDMLHVS